MKNVYIMIYQKHRDEGKIAGNTAELLLQLARYMWEIAQDASCIPSTNPYETTSLISLCSTLNHSRPCVSRSIHYTTYYTNVMIESLLLIGFIPSSSNKYLALMEVTGKRQVHGVPSTQLRYWQKIG